jgi:acyl-CoA dehydrogenase
LQRCLDESRRYASKRTTMGKPIIEHQAIGHKIAEMGMRPEAARLLTYQAAWRCDAGKRNTLETAYAKAFAADSAAWAASETIQIFGGMGYSTEYPGETVPRRQSLANLRRHERDSTQYHSAGTRSSFMTVR